ncbi:MAG: amidohydrolase family protein [Oscillospiraceae bacterium]|nr:amidohydrolase family protein [Oscillospiraceae bacterium]
MKILQGNIVYSPKLGKLVTLPHGALVLDDQGILTDVLPAAPEGADAAYTDYGDQLLMPSFVDMHLHAPQYPMLGMGMDLPLMEWLNTYTFKTEARFADNDYARRTYRRLAADLITGGTTRVCMFSSLHTDATLILMEELERAGVTGYVGKVNMDRNSGEVLKESTEESKRETLRWLDGCAQFRHIKPILTPRFTPSCTNELMAWLGRLSEERGLYVQSHLSENGGEIAFVKELHPDCDQYWETYAKYGLWKDHTVMAHCVHSDAREREALLRHNVVVAHCAGSNINICSGVAPIRTMLREGVWVTLGSDIAGGAILAMNRVITMSIRASKILHMQTDGEAEFLTVDEAYYLGSTAGHRYFGADGGFAMGQPLHAIVVDDSVLAEPVRELTLRERFERSIYLMDKSAIRAVWSDGRQVVG